MLHATGRPLRPDEVTTVKGFKTTSVKRTLLDLAQKLPYVNLLMAMDGALRSKLVTLEDLRAYLESHRRSRHKGKGKFERALEDCEARGRPFRSALEVWWWVVSIDAGFPVPLIEPRMCDEVGELFPDFVYVFQFVIVETKGRQTHGDPLKLEKDARRELRLSRLGYAVISVTWSMMRQNPGRVLDLVRSALEAISLQRREPPPRKPKRPRKLQRLPAKCGPATRERLVSGG